MDNIQWEPLENEIVLPRDPHFPYTGDVTLLVDFVCKMFPEDAKMNICDIGCGSGAILLLLAARRIQWNMTGLEIRENAAKLAQKGITKNQLEERVRIRRTDCRIPQLKNCMDMVVCNPPYRKSGKPSPNPEREIAVGETMGGLQDFCASAAFMLVEGGSFCMIHRSDRQEDIREAIRMVNMEIVEFRLVNATIGRQPNRVLLQAIKKAPTEHWCR